LGFFLASVVSVIAPISAKLNVSLRIIFILFLFYQTYDFLTYQPTIQSVTKITSGRNQFQEEKMWKSMAQKP
jgi:hypothetical protein